MADIGLVENNSALEINLPKESPEQTFKKTLEISKQTMTSLVDFAVSKGIDAKNFDHLANVFTQDSHILMPPVEVMRSELAKISGGETDSTRRTRALRSQKTGEVFVPEEQTGSIHDVLHESIHRAAWLHDKTLGLSEYQTLLANQLATKYGITITTEGKVDPNSKYIQTYGSNDNEKGELMKYFTNMLKEKVSHVAEGLTEWATRKANGLTTKEGTEIHMPEQELSYSDLVKDFEEVKAKMVSQLNIPAEKADAILITAALTGDIKEILAFI